MCRHLLDLWPALWHFLTDEALDIGVEPTNQTWRSSARGAVGGRGATACIVQRGPRGCEHSAGMLAMESAVPQPPS